MGGRVGGTDPIALIRSSLKVGTSSASSLEEEGNRFEPCLETKVQSLALGWLTGLRVSC